MNNRDVSSFYPGGKKFGRFQFVHESPGVSIGSILVLTMASIIGNFGNILILVAICKTLKTKSLGKPCGVRFIRHPCSQPH